MIFAIIKKSADVANLRFFVRIKREGFLNRKKNFFAEFYTHFLLFYPSWNLRRHF